MARRRWKAMDARRKTAPLLEASEDPSPPRYIYPSLSASHNLFFFLFPSILFFLFYHFSRPSSLLPPRVLYISYPILFNEFPLPLLTNLYSSCLPPSVLTWVPPTPALVSSEMIVLRSSPTTRATAPPLLSLPSPTLSV